MTNKEYKIIIRRFMKAFETNDQDTLKELVSIDYMSHAPGLPGPIDREALLQRINSLNSTFSELRVSIEDQIAEGDRVVTRLTWCGTHTGDFQGLAPTGKQVEISAISIERLRDGKIVERWFSQDDLGLMIQLGVVQPHQSRD